MANHGVVTYADSLCGAYMKMETVEHFAQITLVTHILGRQEPLGNEELEKLLVVRSRYQGIRSSATRPLAMYPHPDVFARTSGVFVNPADHLEMHLRIVVNPLDEHTEYVVSANLVYRCIAQQITH